jgi:hypothetical protein
MVIPFTASDALRELDVVPAVLDWIAVLFNATLTPFRANASTSLKCKKFVPTSCTRTFLVSVSVGVVVVGV